VLFGGSGADIFTFVGGSGRDVVADVRGEDRIEFERGRFADFAALMGRASQSGGDVVLAHDGGEVLVLNVLLSSLAADHFLFV